MECVSPPHHTVDFPVEIWLEILSHTETPELCMTSPVSPALRSLAQSLLFQSLVLRIRDHSNLKDEDRFRSKLSFFTSSRIAPLVRTCRLLGVFPKLPDVYGATLCDALSQFPCLRQLILRGVRLTARMVSEIASASLNIQLSLLLAGCSTDTPASREAGTILAEELAMYDSYDESTAKFMQIFTNVKGMHLPALEILCMHSKGIPTYAPGSERKFISVLSCFPSLRTFELHPRGYGIPLFPEWSSELPQTVLPLLSSFHGPDDLAPVFCAGRRITRLKLHGTVGWNTCNLQNLDTHLLAIGRENTILASLEISIGFPTVHLLETITTSFPMLRSLRLLYTAHNRFEEPRPDIQTILNRINTLVLPPRLEVLFLAFLSMKPENENDVIAHEKQDRHILTTIRSLARRFPTLRHICLCTDLWVDRKVVESTATSLTRMAGKTNCDSDEAISIRRAQKGCKYTVLWGLMLPDVSNGPTYAAVEAVEVEWHDATMTHGYQYVRR
ncbi:hypothetical protein MVEN_02405700 [Mycena venus]|uniref:F-box domain-containing protein n=1 Tax=Mycena venus TaxID=2733690 RepID=A0A8H7CCX7_9AGAR|nr:hypothetical protein MVEN_02405700 [Mycena venus]